MLRSRGLAVEQQRQPFGMCEILRTSSCACELDEGLHHAVELERSELIEGGMCEHRVVISSVEVAWGRGCCRELSPARPRALAGRRRSRLFFRIELTERVGARTDIERAAASGFESLAAIGL